MAARKTANRGGRPKAIGDAQLREVRDVLIGILSDGWGQVGPALQKAATRSQIRRALGPLASAPHERLLAPFCIEATTAADRSVIRAAKKELATLYERERLFRGQLTDSTERLRESEAALEMASSTNAPKIRSLHESRQHTQRHAEQTLSEVLGQIKTIEHRLADQRAAFAQDELLHFIRTKKYRFHPANVAAAMAGLPTLGWWQSFRQCGRPLGHVWPTTRYLVFKTIEQAWGDRRDRSAQGLLKRLQRRIGKHVAEPPVGRAARTQKEQIQRTRANVQRHLSQHWRHLRLAVEATDLAGETPHQIPFVIFAAYIEGLAQSGRADERVLAAEEALKPAKPTRRKNAGRRKRRISRV